MPKIAKILGSAAIQILYCLPIPGLTLKLAAVIRRQYPITDDNDCIFIQAFGRNTWSDAELNKKIRILRQRAGYDNVRMMEELSILSFDPGDSNRSLASVALGLCQKHKIPIIAQWEIGYALYKENPQAYQRLFTTGHIHVLWPRGKYYPTWEVKKDAIVIAHSIGSSRPIELAHPDMIVRATAIIWKLGLAPSLCLAAIPYDSRSVQKWTRSWQNWWLRNALSHPHHACKGWVSLIPPKTTSSE
ncbi:MAG: hypothetical protein V1853_02485 [bacterium]